MKFGNKIMNVNKRSDGNKKEIVNNEMLGNKK